jgi:hypothetical protein
MGAGKLNIGDILGRVDVDSFDWVIFELLADVLDCVLASERFYIYC